MVSTTQRRGWPDDIPPYKPPRELQRLQQLVEQRAGDERYVWWRWLAAQELNWFAHRFPTRVLHPSLTPAIVLDAGLDLLGVESGDPDVEDVVRTLIDSMFPSPRLLAALDWGELNWPDPSRNR